MAVDTLVKPHFGSFTITRTYRHAPARVFRAFEDPAAHYRWFVSGDGWEIRDYAHDFRVGGHEHGHFRPEGAPFMLSNDVWYLEIADSQRIVLAYTMAMDGKVMSHSLAVTEFFPVGADSCRLVFTEQGAYYGEATDIANRRTGTEGLFDKLAAELDTHA